MDVTNVSIEWSRPPDEQGVINFLVKEKGFSEQRVRNGLEALKKARRSKPQGRLDAFFKPPPAPLKQLPLTSARNSTGDMHSSQVSNSRSTRASESSNTTGGLSNHRSHDSMSPGLRNTSVGAGADFSRGSDSPSPHSKSTAKKRVAAGTQGEEEANAGVSADKVSAGFFGALSYAQPRPLKKSKTS